MSDAGRDLLDADLAAVLPEIRVLHDFSYLVGSHETTVSVQGEPPARSAMVKSLGEAIYGTYYVRPQQVGQGNRLGNKPLAREFRSHLSLANKSRGGWLNGVKVVAKEGSRIRIGFGGEEMWVESAHVEESADGFARVRSVREIFNPGWYFFFGTERLDARAKNIVRVYWNLSAQGAVPFVRTLSTEFDAVGVPFDAKVLDDPQAFTRADAGVLYLDVDTWDDAAPAIGSAHRRLRPYLRRGVPLLTFPAAEGLGIAEDPGIKGESFGMHRSRIIAEGIWAAFDTGRSDPDACRESVREAFRAHGISERAPYLNPTSRLTLSTLQSVRP